jgi:membrane protease YdiL (CAAX protease family)
VNIPTKPVPLTTAASLPEESYANLGRAPVGTIAPSDDPDNPHWGIFAAALAWIASIVLLVLVQLIFIIPYGIFKYRDDGVQTFVQALQTDPVAILLQIISVIPSHLLTLLVVWAIVTQFGKRPFWRAFGWSWSENFGIWQSVGVAGLMLGCGILIGWLFGGGETQIDQIVASSTAARITVAILATATAPLVEELIYRGLLYSALLKGLTRFNAQRGVVHARRTALISTVFAVSLIFALVHVVQYKNNLGVIVAVALLSLVLTLTRALTGRLLPCFIIHLVFNGIQSLILLFEPLLPHHDAVPSAPTSIILSQFVHHIQNLF